MIRAVLCTDGVFPHALGGMQRHSRLLAEHLAASGQVDLTVIHPHAAPLFDPALGIKEIPIAPIDEKRFYLRELWRYSGRVAEELDRARPQVILSQGFSVWKGIDRFRDRLIVHPHGLEMFQAIGARERAVNWPFRIALKWIVRRSRFVVSLGGRLTDILQGLIAGTSAEVVTIPNAVDVPGQKPSLPRSAGPIRLLFVGRFAFNKGIDVLMQVARRLEAEGRPSLVRFELAGSGPLLATYQAMGLPSNVQLLGRVDDDRLFRLYAECDALVLPTRFEGMPTVVLEAMARARPIMVSDVGATAELVDPGNGYLLPKGDAEALYRAVLAFVDSTAEQREAMGMASWERARSRFDWPAVSAEFMELFRRTVAG